MLILSTAKSTIVVREEALVISGLEPSQHGFKDDRFYGINHAHTNLKTQPDTGQSADQSQIASSLDVDNHRCGDSGWWRRRCKILRLSVSL
jgi:hypothetical protein